MPVSSDLRPNEVRALASLFRTGGLSRAALARDLGLTRSTTGILVQSLVDAGLARERGDGADDDGEIRVGRPGIMVEIDSNGGYFIGAYIGVDRLDVLAIDLSGAIYSKAYQDFAGAGSEPEYAAEVMAGLVAKVVADLPTGRSLYGVNIALPGFLGADGETYHAAILGWHSVNLSRILAKALGLDIPVLLENDANAVAVAETYRSRRSGYETEDCLVILMENGVGGGIVSGGHLHRGGQRGAGEIGHMPLGAAGFVYDAVRPGRLETFLGKDAILARYIHIGGASPNFASFVGALEAGEPAAAACANDWSYWLARGLITLTCVLQPERIVLAGSVSVVYPFVADQVEASLAKFLIEGYPVPKVETSLTGKDGPALGAAYLLHQAFLAGALVSSPIVAQRENSRNFHAIQR